MQTRAMIATHPIKLHRSEALLHAIEAAIACAQTCTSCADCCLAEEMVAELRRCIRLNLDCADICATAAAVGIRQTSANSEILDVLFDACVVVCRACAEECERHAAQHEHCQICAEACRQFMRACDASIPSCPAEWRISSPYESNESPEARSADAEPPDGWRGGC